MDSSRVEGSRHEVGFLNSQVVLQSVLSCEGLLEEVVQEEACWVVVESPVNLQEESLS